MIYTVTFNPAIDYIVQLDGPLQTGEINRNKGEAVYYGGKGINVSGVLKELGQENVALGFVAGFTGEGLEKGLRENGLQTDFIHVSNGLTRINVKVKADQETEINGIGPRITAADMDSLYKRLDKLEKGDCLVLSGSIPSCLQSDTYEQIMAYLQDREVAVAVDATGQLLMNVLKYRPFLIKPNHIELSEIFGTELSTDAQLAECGRKLQALGARNVLISMAGDGAMLLDETGMHKENFNSAVDKANPRTAIGYFEPGHYCFVAVDGRNSESDGLTMQQLSLLMEKLGCKVAYNLDGGKTSIMVWNDQVANVPSAGGRKCSDAVMILDRPA